MSNKSKTNAAAIVPVLDNGNIANGNNLKATIDADIALVSASEATTKAGLSRLSRNLLLYVPNSKDIGAVNRLLDVLTRNNFKVAALFFTAFLPWKFDEKLGKFGAMLNSKADIAKRTTNCVEFLANPENDIWAWAEREVSIEPREKNYKSQIAALVTRALTASGENERYRLSKAEVIQAMLTGGVSVADIVAMATVMQAPAIPADAKPEAEAIIPPAAEPIVEAANA